MAQGKNQCPSLHDPQALIIASGVNRDHRCLSPLLATISPVDFFLTQGTCLGLQLNSALPGLCGSAALQGFRRTRDARGQKGSSKAGG